MMNHWLSKSASLEVKDYHELLALHRVVMEAKFGHDEANDVDILGSPFVSELANRIVETLIGFEESNGKVEAARSWQKWRTLDSSRREWFIVSQRLKQCSKWQEWTTEERNR